MTLYLLSNKVMYHMFQWPTKCTNIYYYTKAWPCNAYVSQAWTGRLRKFYVSVVPLMIKMEATSSLQTWKVFWVLTQTRAGQERWTLSLKWAQAIDGIDIIYTYTSQGVHSSPFYLLVPSMWCYVSLVSRLLGMAPDLTAAFPCLIILRFCEERIRF